MSKYQVEIDEQLTRVITVEAPSKEDAVSIIKDMYKNSEIVLDADDFADVKFSVIVL